MIFFIIISIYILIFKMTSIDSLLKKYAKYIVDDKITNYFNFNLNILNENLDKYVIFLNKYEHYNNNTWLYFKGIYYCCIFDDCKLMSLLDGIHESHIYCLIGKSNSYWIKNYHLMIKYYLMAIELNNSIAMVELGKHYRHYLRNYNLMKKYYLMAIELNNPYAMYYLGHYYGEIEHNYVLMEKYYKMAIEFNNFYALHQLAIYYQNTKQKYDLMKQYYISAIELNLPH